MSAGLACRPEQQTVRLANLGLAVLLPSVGLAGLVIWGSTRGLDLTDEGTYLVYIAERHVGVTSFGALAGVLFGFAADDVVALRLVRLVLMTASAIALAWGVCAWLRRDRGEVGGRVSFLLLAAAALCGSFLSYVDLPQTLSYNSVNNALLVTSAGGVLRFLARPPDERVRRIAWELVAVGVLLALQFFVKFTSAVLCSIAIGSVLLSHARPLGRRGLAIAAVSIPVGVLLGAATFFLLVAAPGDWYAAFRGGIASVGGTTHSEDFVVSRYLWDLSAAARRVPRQYLAPILLTFGALVLHRRAQPGASTVARAAPAVLLTLALFAFGVAAWRHADIGKPREFCNYATYPHVALLIMAGAAGVAWCIASPGTLRLPVRATWERTAIVAFLLVLPFCGTLGSNLHIFRHVLQHAAPWTVALAILAHDLARRGAPGWVPPLAVGVASVVAGLQVVEGYARLPFRVPTGLVSQVEPVTAPDRLRGLRLDGESRVFLERIDELLRASGFRPGDPLIGLFNMNGVVFAVGGSSLGEGVFYIEDFERSARSLARTPRQTLHGSRLLVQAAHRDTAITLLARVGLRFPDDYRLLGTVASPYEGGDVGVYAPR